MTHINGEPVEKVTSFESLRVGDVVWVVQCMWCGDRHRAILTRPTNIGLSRLPDGTLVRSRAWTGLPWRPCDDGCEKTALGDITISEGRAYRVVLNLDVPAESTTEKRPEVVR